MPRVIKDINPVWNYDYTCPICAVYSVYQVGTPCTNTKNKYMCYKCGKVFYGEGWIRKVMCPKNKSHGVCLCIANDITTGHVIFRCAICHSGFVDGVKDIKEGGTNIYDLYSSN